MILVSGSTGRIGSKVVQDLVIKGVPVRAMVHKSNVKLWEFWSEVESVTADMAKPFSVAAAADGCDTAFLASSPDEDQVTLQGNFIEACKMAGVKTIVKLSALGASPDSPVCFLRWHGQTEATLAASGLAYTVLRPHAFMANLLAFGPTIVADGTFVSTLSPQTPIAYVDHRDVAAVAVALLSGAAAPRATLDLTGPDAVDSAGLAERFSRALEKPVAYKRIPRSVLEEALAANGLPAWQARGIGELYAWFDEHPGTAGAVTDVVASLGGHPPRTLDGFIKEFKDRFEPEPVEPEYVEYQDGTFAD